FRRRVRRRHGIAVGDERERDAAIAQQRLAGVLCAFDELLDECVAVDAEAAALADARVDLGAARDDEDALRARRAVRLDEPARVAGQRVTRAAVEHARTRQPGALQQLTKRALARQRARGLHARAGQPEPL